MPKNDLPKADIDSAATSVSTKVEALPMPALGAVCGVTVAEGVVLRNGETGLDFEPGKETPQTVTVTTLRRLEDGCLTRVS